MAPDADIEWITRHMRRFFPREWAVFHAAGGGADDLASAYNVLLHDPDPEVRERAARAWCIWEDTHVAIHGEPESDGRPGNWPGCWCTAGWTATPA